MEERATALFVDRLTKVYADDTHALDALELRVPAGSFFGLLGPNGAGKTTLIGSVEAGPVAWSSSKPRLGYVVGFDQTLYKADDGGATWRPVA